MKVRRPLAATLSLSSRRPAARDQVTDLKSTQAASYSIPELLNLNPGFSSSRSSKRFSVALGEKPAFQSLLSPKSPLLADSWRNKGQQPQTAQPITQQSQKPRRASTNDGDLARRRRSSFAGTVTASHVPRSSKAASFALSRGLAVATVKTTYQRGGDSSVPQSARSVVSVQDDPSSPLTSAAELVSMAEKQQQVPRTEREFVQVSIVETS